MNTRAVIVDDELPAREYLKLLLERIGGIEIVGEAGDATGCLRLLAEHQPDIAFLDIRLPGMEGIELANVLGMMEHAPRIVFVTGYDDYAVEAFNQAAVDYVMKPFDQARLQKTVDRLLNGNGARNGAETPPAMDNRLAVKQEDGWRLLHIQDIMFARTEGRKVRVQARTESFMSHYTIGELDDRLSQYGFFRANEGCLVNLKYVSEILTCGIRSYELLLKGQEDVYVPLSRSKAQKLRELLRLH